MFGLNLIVLYRLLSEPVHSAANLFNRGADGVGKVLDLWVKGLRRVSETKIIDKSLEPITALMFYSLVITVITFLLSIALSLIIIVVVLAGLGKLFEYAANKIQKKLQEENGRKNEN